MCWAITIKKFPSEMEPDCHCLSMEKKSTVSFYLNLKTQRESISHLGVPSPTHTWLWAGQGVFLVFTTPLSWEKIHVAVSTCTVYVLCSGTWIPVSSSSCRRSDKKMKKSCNLLPRSNFSLLRQTDLSWQSLEISACGGTKKVSVSLGNFSGLIRNINYLKWVESL